MSKHRIGQLTGAKFYPNQPKYSWGRCVRALLGWSKHVHSAQNSLISFQIYTRASILPCRVYDRHVNCIRHSSILISSVLLAMVPSRAKVALVTASSAGLGAAIAKVLAKDHSVAINYYSSPAKAEAVIKELERTAPSDNTQEVRRFCAFKADLGDKAAVQKLVETVWKEMGSLDVLVSNGGWTEVRGFEDLDANIVEEDWDRCWNINVKSHLWLLHAARKFLEQADGSGAFVTVASIAGVKPSGSSLVSSAVLSRLYFVVKNALLMSCMGTGVLRVEGCADPSHERPRGHDGPWYQSQ